MEQKLSEKGWPEYLGAWTDGVSFERGAVVSRNGGMWIAERTTGLKPGDADSGWRLCVTVTKIVFTITGQTEQHAIFHEVLELKPQQLPNLNALVSFGIYNVWAKTAGEFVSDLFMFSLFYLGWNWSVRHFRAHWHNFILNAYRYRALWVLRQMGGDYNQKGAVTRMSGLLLLLSEDSAYLDKEQPSSGLQKVMKLDDWMKKQLTGAPAA